MKIAIAGYGVEGQASYQYWADKGDEVTIVDERDELTDVPVGAKTVLGSNAFLELGDVDLVVRTAGLSPRKIQTKGKIWSATNEFFAHCPAPIIGVTGTKGKGTTASLIASILKVAGKTVHLVGNIGTPALEILPTIKSDDIVVYELSSFQLWDAQKSPQIAVVLPIEPDHLDVHDDFEDYIAAKANITRHQTPDDTVIYHKNNQYAAGIAQASLATQKKAYPQQLGREIIDALQLPGAHNHENLSAAVLAVEPYVTDEAAIARGVAGFTGLEHRLKYVATHQGVDYYDDSIATTPGSALAAVASFTQPKILLLGGRDKGGDYHELMQTCAQQPVQVIAYGENRQKSIETAMEYGTHCIAVDGDMTMVVKKAAQLSRPGSVVILSPAASSFDMFTNYQERGQQFIEAVSQLGD